MHGISFLCIQFFDINFVHYLVKKIFRLYLIIHCLNVSAQSHFENRYKYGFKMGYTLHTITGGRVKSLPKGYFEGGLWLQLELSKKWTAQTEILYVEKGTGGYNKGGRPHYGDYWVGLYYIEVPILFQYHRKKIMLEFGPGLGYLVYGHENVVGYSQPDMTDIYPFTKRELSFNFGFGYTINEKWNLVLRFTHSLLPVRQQLPSISKQVYNRVFAFARSVNIKKQKALNKQNQE